MNTTVSEEYCRDACKSCKEAMSRNNDPEVAKYMKEVCNQCQIVMNRFPELKQAFEDLQALQRK